MVSTAPDLLLNDMQTCLRPRMTRLVAALTTVKHFEGVIDADKVRWLSMVLWCADSLVVLSVDHHVRRHGVSGFNAHDMTRHDVIIFRFRNVPLLIRTFFSGILHFNDTSCPCRMPVETTAVWFSFSALCSHNNKHGEQPTNVLMACNMRHLTYASYNISRRCVRWSSPARSSC